MIRGNTVGTTMPRSDWNQSDPKMPDYIKGKEAVDEAILKAQSTADSALAAAGKAQSTADGKVAKTEASATLESGKWADKKQMVNVSGVTKDNTVIVGPSTDSHVAYCEAVIRYYEQGEGTITFICEDVPSVDIMLNVLILDEDASGGPHGSGNGESGVLSVTIDPDTALASHSPAEILEAVHSGKSVQLYCQSENVLEVLPLFLATQNEAVFSATGYGGYDRGYYTRTYEAFVRSDRTVDFVNDGFFDSRCVPDFEPEDAGKVLGVAKDGLEWIAHPKGGSMDLTGYATEEWVQEGYQPRGEYLTAVPDGYAKTVDIPTKPEDIGAQPAGNYLTAVPSGYATEEFVRNRIAEAELGGKEVDLSGYAQKSEIPAKVSQLQNDSGYLTEVPAGYAKTTDIPTKPEDIGAQPAGNYLTEVPGGYATEEFVEQSLARTKTGVLCVTADYSTRIASHSPAEILEAVNSGKGVCLCVVNTDGIAVLSLIGVETDSGKAVFCSTVYDGLVFGHRLGILQASVSADKSVTFANDGSVLSMCVPVAENTDVGKILGVTEDGLEWSEPPEGGVLQVTVDPASNLASHSPAEILAAASSGKTVQLYHQAENEAEILPLFLATQNEAVFSATGYGGYDRGYYTRTYEARVRSDRTVDFVNEGFFDSRCVPDFGPEDAGKYLAAGEDGLVWSAMPEGSNGKDGVSPTVTVTDITGGHRVAITDAKGTKTFDVMDGKDGESGSGGGSGIPVIDLQELGFPDVDGLGYYETVMFDQTTWETLKTMIEYGVVKIKMRRPSDVTVIDGFLCSVYGSGDDTQYLAERSYGTQLFTFTLSPGNGVYGAQVSVTGS